MKITDTGQVKVLDFGLAKAMAPPSSPDAAANSPTASSPAMTRDGAVLGTAAYMSPEQARGKPVDKRTDVWAFGCVFYEMLTGEPAFAGDTTADSLVRIVAESPDFAALPPATPPAVRRVMQRCLEKDSRERLRDIGDARIEIGQAMAAQAAEVGPADRAGRRRGADNDRDDEEARRQQKRIEGCRMAGLIVTASGLGSGPLLYGLVPDSGLFLVAAMPTAIGAALLVYGFTAAPQPPSRAQ